MSTVKVTYTIVGTVEVDRSVYPADASLTEIAAIEMANDDFAAVLDVCDSLTLHAVASDD